MLPDKLVVRAHTDITTIERRAKRPSGFQFLAGSMPIETKYLKGCCQSCGGHIEYPAEAVGTTIDCPHCSKPTELLLAVPPDEPTIPHSTIIWTVATALMLLAGLWGALAALKRAEKKAAEKRQGAEAAAAVVQSSQSVQAPAQPEVAINAGFRSSVVTLQKNPGSSLVYAVATLTNTAARQRFGVKVFLDLLDETGNKVGEATDYQQLIEPGGQWSFKALVVAPRTASANIASIKEER